MTWNVQTKGEVDCRNCGAPATDLHHIVPKGVTRRAHNLTYNAMPLCHDCHMGHHHRQITITREKLTLPELAFATAAAGEAWLDTWYPIELGPM